MRIAIVGAGISGLTAAYHLSQQHEICVYESAPVIGGHTATVDVESHGRHYAVDTGFIVYNDWTYPNFIALLDELNVQNQPTRMSFSVSNEASGLEYAGSNLDTLFAQRRNLLSPAFWRLLKDIVRFNREAIEDLEQQRINESMTLGVYLANNGYSREFTDNYLVPMGAAIWSAGIESMLDFPLLFFVRFFKNHGLLSIRNRPQWRVIKGGSRQYLAPLTSNFLHRIRTNTHIESISRVDGQVTIRTRDGDCATYDYLVMATHSDQALSLLEQPSFVEQEILGAIPYQSNEVVLHTDVSLLPQKRKAWACWNYRLYPDQSEQGQDGALRSKLTYNMNLLQGIDAPETFCVSLNQSGEIDESRVLREFNYSHPVFTLPGMAAQARWSELAGENNTWYCGAYWANGFHEDGVSSALKVVDSIAQRDQCIDASGQPVRAGRTVAA